jgi:hypothetical protein
MTPRERQDIVLAARACAAVAHDVEERTTDLSDLSHRNMASLVHELAESVARLGRAVEQLARLA